MGIASLILGIVSIVIGFIPFCGAIALVPAVVGLILGIVEVVLKSKKKEKFTLGIVGLVLSALAVVVIVVWIFVLGSTLSITNNILNSIQIDDNMESNENDNIVYAIGEDGTLDGATIKVTNVSRSNGSSWNKPQEGKEYVIVTVAIRNTGSNTINYNPFDYQIQNSQGQVESQTLYTGDNDTHLSSGDLVPGGSVTGTIAFEQPIGDNNLTLIYHENAFASKSLKFKLQ